MNDKNAYNNQSDYIPRTHPYNTEKWLAALRQIKIRSNAGVPYVKAYEMATQGWEQKEIRDFHNWVRFYEEQGHMKYTTAQLYGYEGYYLPTSPVPSPVVVIKKEPGAQDSQPAIDPAASAKAAAEEKKKILLEHRKKILSRLQATRKLFTQEHGKQLAGENLNHFLDILNDLEKQIHGLTASASVMNAVILRQANFLDKQGATKSAEVIRSFADNLPGGLPPADPNASIPDGGAIPNTPPAVPGEEAPAEMGDEGANPALLQFLRGLNGEDPFEDNNDAELDDVEIDDESKEDSLEVEDMEGIIIEAQAAPAAPDAPLPEAPVEDPAAPQADVAPEPELEVTEDAPAEGEELHPSKDFDSLIDAAFSNLKVSDIVKRLDDLSRIFKNREIARQLSIVDMMMDKLGLSTFFPSLAEATRSALESNQYCLVRIDEVKSRLAGAMDTVGKSLHDMGQEHSISNQQEGIDLMGNDTSPDDPLLNQVKNTLDSQQKKEKLKKELRKSVEDNALLEAGNKQKAEVADLSQELEAEPAAKPAPAPAAPAAPQTPAV